MGTQPGGYVGLAVTDIHALNRKINHLSDPPAVTEIQEAISVTMSKKAAGHDGIPSEGKI